MSWHDNIPTHASLWCDEDQPHLFIYHTSGIRQVAKSYDPIVGTVLVGPQGYKCRSRHGVESDWIKGYGFCEGWLINHYGKEDDV